MDSTARETLEFLEENDIKFIRLAFCDIFGVQKNIAVMASQLGHALEHGVAFDASAIAGFGGVARSDLCCGPTCPPSPCCPGGRPKAAWALCSATSPTGRPPLRGRRPLAAGPAGTARCARAIPFLVGPECEFYLFETDEKGRPTHTPFGRGGLF